MLQVIVIETKNPPELAGSSEALVALLRSDSLSKDAQMTLTPSYSIQTRYRASAASLPEGAPVLKNGCQHHDDCFTCPFNDCRLPTSPPHAKGGKDYESEQRRWRKHILIWNARKRGLSIKQIARSMKISERTVARYLARGVPSVEPLERPGLIVDTSEPPAVALRGSVKARKPLPAIQTVSSQPRTLYSS